MRYIMKDIYITWITYDTTRRKHLDILVRPKYNSIDKLIRIKTLFSFTEFNVKILLLFLLF